MQKNSLELIKEIARESPTKIVMMVIDGLGGLPQPDSGKTELEAACTPNLDALASGGICGLSYPISPGITPGSAPGHLALFGYDPLVFRIGRGVLEALGVGFKLEAGDVAARGNFCTLDKDGLITDRRAGRISTDVSSKLCRLLEGIEISGIKIIVRPVKDHRFIAVFRGDELRTEISESDPQQTGVAVKEITPKYELANRTADIVTSLPEEQRQS